jgi:hypothetical protein
LWGWKGKKVIRKTVSTNPLVWEELRRRKRDMWCVRVKEGGGKEGVTENSEYAGLNSIACKHTEGRKAVKRVRETERLDCLTTSYCSSRNKRLSRIASLTLQRISALAIHTLAAIG